MSDKNFAVIEDGIVTNIILAPSLHIAEMVTGKACHEYTSENLAHIGLKFENGVFEQPPALVVVPPAEPPAEEPA